MSGFSILRFGLLAAVAVLFACSSEECVDKRDCPTGQECINGTCKREVVGTPNPRRDAGPRPDATVTDGSTSTVTDGGTSTDGSVGPDGGVGPDATAGADRSIPDAGPDGLPNSGLIWVGEVGAAQGATEITAFGELLNHENVTYSKVHQTFAHPDGTCELNVLRVLTGTVTGFEVTRIGVTTGPRPSFSMFPVGNGRFEPLEDPGNRLFEDSNSVIYTVEASTAAGSLESYLGGALPPQDIVTIPLTPDIDIPFHLPSDVTLHWEPATLPITEIVVEIFDRDREVVLTCTTPDVSADSYEIPAAITNAWVQQGPVAPAHLELRYQGDVLHWVPFVGGGALPVSFRTSQGWRWDVTF